MVRVTLLGWGALLPWGAPWLLLLSSEDGTGVDLVAAGVEGDEAGEGLIPTGVEGDETGVDFMAEGVEGDEAEVDFMAEGVEGSSFPALLGVLG